MSRREGWEGWDEYAPFYDWENARTLGRRDVPFWQRVVADAAGRCSSSAAAPAGSRCRSRAPASSWSASIARRRCSTAPSMRGKAAVSAPGAGAASQARARRHPRICRSPAADSVRDRAVRHPAVAPAERDLAATLAVRRPRAGARRHLRHRPGARRAALARIQRPRAVARPRGGRRASHARSNRSARIPAPADDLRAALPRAPRPRRSRASVRADVPDPVRSSDDPPARTGRVSRPCRARRLPRPRRGTSAPTSGSSWRKRCKIFRPISLISQEFRHVRPFQVGIHQAQEGRR